MKNNIEQTCRKRWTATPVDVPADGTCLFHSIAYDLGLQGKELRKLVYEFIRHNPSKKLHDASLSDWISWDMGVSVSEYTEKLKNGQWGGSIETTLLSSFLGIPIFVYSMKKKNTCCRIAESRPDTTIEPILKNYLKSADKNIPNFISVLYVNKSHYMFLKIRQIIK